MVCVLKLIQLKQQVNRELSKGFRFYCGQLDLFGFVVR